MSAGWTESELKGRQLFMTKARANKAMESPTNFNNATLA